MCLNAAGVLLFPSAFFFCDMGSCICFVLAANRGMLWNGEGASTEVGRASPQELLSESSPRQKYGAKAERAGGEEIA